MQEPQYRHCGVAGEELRPAEAPQVTVGLEHQRGGAGGAVEGREEERAAPSRD